MSTKKDTLTPGALVLGADSVVVTADGAMIAKPETRSRAEAQLKQLQGDRHTADVG